MTGQWTGGKGSKPRPLSVDRKTYESNWDRIFGEKAKRARVLDELTKLGQEMGEYEHENCGTPECCGECETTTKNKNDE